MQRVESWKWNDIVHINSPLVRGLLIQLPPAHAKVKKAYREGDHELCLKIEQGTSTFIRSEAGIVPDEKLLV